MIDHQTELVLQDIVRRERIANPHSQFFFWRTSTGSELDLIVERGAKRFAIEIKSGRGNKAGLARSLEQALSDAGANKVWILDQGEGSEPLGPRVERRSWSENTGWLPK